MCWGLSHLLTEATGTLSFSVITLLYGVTHFPIPSVEATVISRLLVDEVIARHGAPRVLMSDRGKNFLCKVVADVCKIFQMHKVNTSSYHPLTDGLVKRFNATLCQSLSMYVAKNKKGWDDFIPLVLFVIEHQF